jgi:hypothetical protein
MADAYLAISQIANDRNMNERMRSATTQQHYLGSAPLISDPIRWVGDNMYVWASSPGWGAAWESALAAHPDDPDYEPGADPAVITDGMILSTVQELGS